MRRRLPPYPTLASYLLSTPQGYAHEIPLPCFLHNVLPSLSREFVPAQIVRTLKCLGGRSSSRKPITLEGKWRGFALDPARTKRSEKRTFFHLRDVAQAILKASGGKNPPASFRHNPECVMSDERRNEDTLPDVYLTSGSPHWTDIVAFGELKKHDSEEDVKDNMLKITKSMARCMYSDPRRRFLFAFTIENTTMRLWFCDRSQILISEPFNFITEHEPVVHFFLSLMYAEPENIGMDPTMALSKNGKHHDITVYVDDSHTETYRTLQLLADYNWEMIRCKGSRVWKAIKIEGGRETGEPVALKDVWLDSLRSPEGFLFDRFHSASRPANQHEQIDGLFVTVQCHGDVRIAGGDGTVLDRTRFFGPKGTLPNELVKSREELHEGAMALEASSSDHFAPKPLIHYRIVYKEICKSLEDETSLPRIFRALAQTAIALQSMHKAGWVHRDVSPGNILLNDGEGALLGDFEFAKPMGPDDEFRIGTADFIAVEIAKQRYKFRDITRSPDTLYDVQYNPLHDLESLWWIAVCFLVKKEIVDSAVAEDDQTAIASCAQRIYADELFHDMELRDDTIVLPGTFSEGVRNLPPSLFPITEQLENLRWLLNQRYWAEERNIRAITFTCGEGLHEEFHDVFEGIARAEKNQNLMVRPFTPLRNPYLDQAESSSSSPVASSSSSGSSKRKRSESEDNAESMRPGKRKRPYLPRRAKAPI